MKNIDDTIQVISDDYRKLIMIKSRYDLDNEKTIAQVFSEFEEAYRVLNSARAIL